MSGKAKIGGALLAALLVASAAGGTFDGNAFLRGAIRVDGVNRTYLVHLPANHDPAQAYPLVLALHGRMGNGEQQAKLSGLNGLADREGFIVAYPNGAKACKRGWADGRGKIKVRGVEIDDVKFFSALLDRLEADYKIDPARVYATGMSNGGFMSLRLACDLAGRIAAVAAVGSTMGADLAARCQPARPVSVMIVAGDADPIVDFQGGAVAKSDFNGPILSAPHAAARWADLDVCYDGPSATELPAKVDDGTRVVKVHYGGCGGGSEVVLYQVHGGGHAWPGGEQYLPEKIIGKTSQNLDASAVIWDFFKGSTRR